MAMQTFKATLTGVRPLLMHNGQLADPTNEFTKAIKKVTSANKGKNKTEARDDEIRKLEWMGGLYRDESGAIAVTEDMILGCAIAGAMKSRKGAQAKAAVLGAAPFFPLKYKGPSDLEGLYREGRHCDYRLVVVNRGRVMRARPKFNTWSVDIELLVETTLLSESDLLSALETAGMQVGLGDFRPRFGRFTVKAG